MCRREGGGQELGVASTRPLLDDEPRHEVQVGARVDPLRDARTDDRQDRRRALAVEIPLDEEPILSAEDGRPLGDCMRACALRRICKRVGLRPINWYTFRHTFASHLVMGGAPLAYVQHLMGHSSLTMTMRYAHLAPSTVPSAVGLLNDFEKALTSFGQPVGNGGGIGPPNAMARASREELKLR